MQLTVTDLPSQTPAANPFREDAYHMGIKFASEWVIMHPQHPTEDFTYCIFVHRPSGRRFRLQVED